MKQQFEKKYFAASDCGLNADDVDVAVGINQWVNLQNARVGTTDKGVTGVVESIGGTLRLSEAQPSVTFICIGAAVDSPNNRFFYFLYNKHTPDHKIMCYDDNAKQVYTVLLSSQVTGGLNFSKDYVIHSARVVGNLLYWTDNLNEPRRINVEAAIKLNNPSYSTTVEAYTSPLSQSVIKLIRRPPVRALAATPVTEGGRPNFIKYFAGQFAIRYVYRDGEISVVGPPSDIVNYRLDIINPSVALTPDTSDAIDIEINFPAIDGEYIDQDVQIVQYLVRYDNSPQYFVVKEWNKDNPDELSEIEAYNTSGTSLAFRFYNDKIGVPVDNASSVKPYDSVPLLSETLELGLSRLFLGNNLLGYNTPAVTSMTATPSTPATMSAGSEIFKSNSSYQVAVEFLDFEKRKSSVVTNENLVVAIPDRGDWDSSTFTQYIQWAFSNTNAINEIPDWAYYYRILITKNLRTRFFVQFRVNAISYVIKNNDGTFTYTSTYSAGIYGVALGVGYLSSQGAGISFTQGDKVRVYIDATPAESPVDLDVLAQDGEYIICSPKNLNITGAGRIFFVEYYIPYFQSGEEPFYSTSGCFRVSAPTTDGRQYSVLSGDIGGDCYMIPRLQSSTAVSTFTENMSPNDYRWKEWLAIYGETNIVTLLGQVQKTTSVKWSNTLIEGTLVNGLSTFDALDEKLLPSNMGALMKLQQTSKVQQQGNIMLAIGEDETASLYLGEVQVVGSDANAFLASSPNVIGTVNILKGSFGTTHPESVSEYRGNVYWWDDGSARIIQYSTGGLYPVSNYKMTRYWKQFTDTFKSLTSSQIENLGGRPFVFTTVDPYHDELLLSVPKLLSTPPSGYLPDLVYDNFNPAVDIEGTPVVYPFDIWDGQGKTMVFKVGTNPNFWQGSYSFNPEFFVTLGSSLYSFKNGQLFLHNQTSNYNRFYDDGASYKSRIMCIFNQEGTVPKVYNAVKVEANILPSLTYFRSEVPYVQGSDLMDYDYRDLEGMYYATLYRNRIQPTATGYTTTSLLTGEKMRTYALRTLIEFSINNNVPLQLRYLTLEYNMSRGHLV